MNRIFFLLVAVSFVFGAWRQVTWEPPAPQPVTEVVQPLAVEHADPAVAELAKRLAALEPAPDTPSPPTPPMAAIQDKILERAEVSVNLAISLIGGMAFFLGLMKVAEEGGMLTILAKLIRPLMVRIFPDVPPDHPAMAAMILNLAANALGLGNAATPFGIKAMTELDKLNRHKGTATNAMILFLAINTSSVTLLPKDVIVLRRSLGSELPADILSTTLFATLFSTTCAVIGTRIYQRFSPSVEDSTPPEDIVELDESEETEDTGAYPTWVSAIAIASLVLAIPLTVRYGRVVAPWVIPTLTVALISFGHFRGVPVYEAFVRGAREGWDISVRIVPYLVAILCVVGMFQASGALGALIAIIDPVTGRLGLPAEALPMALLRPLSGSGAQGLMVDVMSNPATGPDTYTGFIVSTMMGSTETTFYVLAVYFGAVNIKRIRHAMVAALTADLAGVVGTVLAVSMYFAYNA